MRLVPMALGALLLATPVAFSQSDAIGPPLVVVDNAEVFAGMAVSTALFSVEASETALQRTRNEQVRAFAEKVLAERRATAERLVKAAEQDSLSLNARMSPRHEAEAQTLRAANDQLFDDLYLAGQRRAMDEEVTLYQGFATAGQAGALRDTAGELLPGMVAGQEEVRALTSPSG
ncbi:DUF4142 domain-containing protein [Cereibacter azotoformans]|uniref:Putative outer membrane protein n=1 Tax=Cereibacter azotoformans TaxID=43057 RepID=A0A2T5K2X1_9RHOB|nr:DUF4142 domain-containing protein [Cereibacter azotoformans]AXQ94655.1 DUF4142 domain-containing protein [Cereibacter sphaeroides]MBO4170496.1 DUF4142 domain-containing protein [Cereibacter azotoformans]PTR16765.1 putative outer membrane protein [Cereibacter azotoformans]UIJ30216.1 DUF4142 domain-containing protein [Cereibacter azotoformans]